MNSQVLAAISRITKRCAISPAQTESLKLLQDSKTKVIVTGQQVGLFGGPLLTLYKALGCVLYAREFSRQNKIPSVPIFWLQTEDHDFDEVATTHFLAVGGASRSVSARDASAGATRASLHYRILGSDIESALEAVREALLGAPNGAWLCDLLAITYRAGQTWEIAFQALLHELLKNTGILFFQPRDESVAELCAPIYRRAIEQHDQITTLLQATLGREKLVEQVRIRPGSPLPFFHVSSADSDRVRLVARGQEEFDFIGMTGAVSKSELLRLSTADPLRFSASALLRPILQQALLQPAQYVGGAAEREYFKQIVELFDFFELDRPVVVERPAARLLDHKFAGWLSEYNFSLSEVMTADPQFINLLASKSGFVNPEQIKEQVNSRLADVFRTLEENYVPVDATLQGAIERTRAKISPSFEGLHERLVKAMAARDQVRIDRLNRIRAQLLPGGVEQERHFSALSFLARSGLGFVEQVSANLKLHSSEPVAIELE